MGVLRHHPGRPGEGCSCPVPCFLNPAADVTRAGFISILARLDAMTARRLLFTRASAQVLTAYLKRLLLAKRASGTNGWMSSWGTNAHGEIAGCPPPRTC